MANMGSNYINIVTCQLIFLPKTDDLMDPGIFLRINSSSLFFTKEQNSVSVLRKKEKRAFRSQRWTKTNSVHSMQVAIGVL